MLTLAVLLLTFVVARTLGGTGALSALFLGLIIGNAPVIAKLLKFKVTSTVDDSVRGFHRFTFQLFFVCPGAIWPVLGVCFSWSSICSCEIILFEIGKRFREIDDSNAPSGIGSGSFGFSATNIWYS
jgi:NhaP-type Na+/H+ or K+/H+ antiporter